MIRIATRNSQLALWQAEYIRRLLLEAHADLNEEDIVLVPLKSDGDQRKDIEFSRFGYKGIFTRRIEDALLNDEADIAVHSMKDVASVTPDELIVAAMPPREDVRDAWISPRGIAFAALGEDALVGTASVRRAAMLRHLKPALNIETLRGNVPTRLERAVEFDGILLAAAGLKRLKLDQNVTEYLPVEDFLPAAGQGAVGVQCRRSDAALVKRLEAISHAPTLIAVTAERAAVGVIDGDCSTPVGAYAQIAADGMIDLCLRYYTPEGEMLEVTRRGADAEVLGRKAGEAVKAQL
jgi:hydroxymethylbilane synthase